MAYVDEHELLSDWQHAFRKWHSCETQITTVINDWAKILDKNGQVDTYVLDFEKAFDTPPHELLKSKLFSYGIGGTTLNWIMLSFLQTTTGSGNWHLIGLDSSCVECPSGHRSRPLPCL